MSEKCDMLNRETVEELFEDLYEAVEKIESHCEACSDHCECVNSRREHLRYHVCEALNRIDAGNYPGARDSLIEGLRDQEPEIQEEYEPQDDECRS